MKRSRQRKLPDELRILLENGVTPDEALLMGAVNATRMVAQMTGDGFLFCGEAAGGRSRGLTGTELQSALQLASIPQRPEDGYISDLAWDPQRKIGLAVGDQVGMGCGVLLPAPFKGWGAPR